MSSLVAILDACVLYPAPLRDLLMRLALADIFKAKWTERIQDEWSRNLLENNSSVSKESVEKTRRLMSENARDALVEDYEKLIDGLNLPDRDDRHVLAAAIRCNASSIITFNIKDFPNDRLAPWGIEAVHPDDFLECQFDLETRKFINTVASQRNALRNPPFTVEMLFDSFTRNRIPKTVALLRPFSDML